MRLVLRAILDRTVWSRDYSAHHTVEQRHFYQWVLPLIYAANAASYSVFGTVGGGSRVMQQYLMPAGTIALSSLIAVASLAALLAEVMRAQHVERVGAVGLVFGALVYLVLLAAGLSSSQPPAGAVASTFSLAVLITFRVLQLSRNIGKTKRRRS